MYSISTSITAKDHLEMVPLTNTVSSCNNVGRTQQLQHCSITDRSSEKESDSLQMHRGGISGVGRKVEPDQRVLEQTEGFGICSTCGLFGLTLRP